MNRAAIIKSLASSVFLVSESYLDTYLPFVADFMSGKNVAVFSEEETKARYERLKPFAVSVVGNSMTGRTSLADAPKGSVAVIAMDGPIMKEDNCGAPGTATLLGRFNAAKNSENISAIVFSGDSGGGEINGTKELRDAIASSPKPVVSFINGNSASAMYWIHSAGSKIIASSATSMIGSIGVASSVIDQKERLAALGMKEIYVVADGSEDKNKAYFDLKAGNPQAYKNEVLNPIKEIFHADVKSSRPTLKLSSKNEPLTGKVYLAEEAIKVGLIDGIGTLEDAIQEAFNLANDKQSNSNVNSNNMKIKWSAATAAIAAFFDSKEGEEKELASADLERLNAELVTLNSVKADLETAKEANKAAIEGQKKAEKATADLQAEFDAFKKGNPGATETVETEEQKKVKADAGKEDFLSPADAQMAEMRKNLNLN